MAVYVLVAVLLLTLLFVCFGCVLLCWYENKERQRHCFWFFVDLLLIRSRFLFNVSKTKKSPQTRETNRVCLLACVFVCLFCVYVLFVARFVCLFVCSFVCSFVRSFVCVCVCSFACLFVYLFVCLIVCLFACFGKTITQNKVKSTIKPHKKAVSALLIKPAEVTNNSKRTNKQASKQACKQIRKQARKHT